MLLKIYALIWIIGLLTVGFVYFTGNLNPVMQIFLGF